MFKTGLSLPEIIKQTLQDNLPEGLYASFYIGDPIAIPQSLMPAIIIEPVRSAYPLENIGLQRHDFTCRIKVVVNKKDDIGKSEEEVVADLTLLRMVEGDHEDTADRLAEQSVVNILETNKTLNSEVFNSQITDILYDVFPRVSAENAEDDIFTAEAHITYVLSRLLEIPNRV